MKNENIKLVNIPVFIILLLFTACSKKPVAKVDGLPVYKENIEDERGILHAYGANYTDEEIILLIFQQKLREYVLSKKLGISITKDMLHRERERIDRETKAPEILSRVKEYFKGDEKRYLKEYVYPVLVSRLLEGTFYFDTTIQKQSYILAREKFEELKENPDKKIKNDSLYIYVDLEKIQKEYEKYQNKFPIVLPFYQMDTAVLKKLPIRDVYPEIIEDRLGYYILRKLDKKSKKFDGFFIRKREFNKWFWDNIKDVRIDIFDPQLKKKVLSRVGNSYIRKLIVE